MLQAKKQALSDSEKVLKEKLAHLQEQAQWLQRSKTRSSSQKKDLKAKLHQFHEQTSMERGPFAAWLLRRLPHLGDDKRAQQVESVIFRAGEPAKSALLS